MKQPNQADEAVAPPQVQSIRPNTPIWYAVVVAVVVVATLAGFFAGIQVGGRSDGVANRSMNGQVPGGMGMMAAGMGTVAEVSETSITVESQAPPISRSGQSDNSSGATKTYKITSDTKVTNDGETAAITDIKSGDRVMVRASDDETTAESIEINPQMSGGRGMNTQSGTAPGANS